MTILDAYTFRSFAGKEDYARMAELLQAISTDGDKSHWATAEDVERDYQHLENSDPATDMCMVANPDGSLAAYARVFWTCDDTGQQWFGFPFFIHPAHRSGELNRALLQWVERRAAEIAGERALLRAMVGDSAREQVMAQALEQEGYQPVRYGYRMIRDLTQPILELPLPDGLEVRAVPEAHYRAVLDATDEAFRDHWGYRPLSDTAYEQFRASKNFQPKLWQVAWDGDQVAGGILNFIEHEANQQFGQKVGWTDPIFTRRPWRRRGLARALLMRSLQLLKDQGMEQASLGVDTQNRSGALALYESCGFVMEHESVFYEKAIQRA